MLCAPNKNGGLMAYPSVLGWKRIITTLSCSMMAWVCHAQHQVKLYGQFIGDPPIAFSSVSISSPFSETSDLSLAVSDLGFFSATVDVKERGVYVLEFKTYAVDFVLASEPQLWIKIHLNNNIPVKIDLENSEENSAYEFARMLMNDQFRMYSFFKNCDADSCVAMLQIEVEAYQNNIASLRERYPGTYASDVMGRFYDIRAPSELNDFHVQLKKEFLTRTPWQLTEAYKTNLISRAATLYLEFAPDSAEAFVTGLKQLIDRTTAGTNARNDLGNVLFDMLYDTRSEEELRQFMLLASDSTHLFSDLTLKEKCKHLAKVMAGEKAPEIYLPDSSGNEVSLLDCAKKHPFTLLVIWEPECSHCIESMPRLKEIYNRYHPQGLEIFGVSLSEAKKEWTASIKENAGSWRNVRVNEQNRHQPEEYYITYTPTFALINNQGVIVRRQLALEDIDEVLTALFKN
jgi:thiol-disulfide isomerase/thioredoxin